MTWIAFGSVPTILVAMLAMGRLEARLLPQPPQPPPNGAGDPIRAEATPRAADTDTDIDTGTGPHRELHWEVVVGPVESREEART
jgi:hypothetical protein